MAAGAPRWIRVRDRETGHEFDISPRAMRPKHEPLNDPRWPDMHGEGKQPRRPVHYVSKDGGPASRPRKSRIKPAPATPADQTGAPQ